MELGTFGVILTLVALNLSAVVSGTTLVKGNFSGIEDIEKYQNESSLQTNPHHSFEEDQDWQDNALHWYPYQRIMYVVSKNGEIERFCKPPGSSIDEFPTFFDRDQRLHGLIAIHFFIALYVFIVIAFICDKYFLPSVERICQVLNISPDVAASTFMATATSMPEFFANTISVFVAESDMGLGAIVGSMLFNTLGVAASASLFTKKHIQMDWWPITRDAIVFTCNLSALVVIVWDGEIMWWETIIFVVLYICYWLLMFQNPRIMKVVKNVVEDRWLWCQRIKNYDIPNQRPKDMKPPAAYGTENPAFNASKSDISTIGGAVGGSRNNSFDGPPPGRRDRRASFDLTRIDDIEEEADEVILFSLPVNGSKFDYFWFFFTWPIRFLLHYTIPCPIKYKKWFALSFFLCIVWIAVMAYIVFWMVVIIGDTFKIPEPIMGFTLLAFGGCMPEAISAVIVARKGSGQMGVSNALGANSLNILFSLGLPWFIRTMTDVVRYGADKAFLEIGSYGIQFTILGLVFAIAALYITVAAFGYQLRKTVGAFLFTFYIILASVAILIELDIILPQERDC